MVASGAGQVSHTKCSACKWHWVSHCIVIKTVLFIARGSCGFLEELREDLHWLTPPHPFPPLLWNICRHKRVEGSNLSQSVSRSALFQRTHRLVLKKTKTTNQNKTKQTTCFDYCFFLSLRSTSYTTFIPLLNRMQDLQSSVKYCCNLLFVLICCRR